jgi:N,N'-diacetyllegionaminate synthase
MGRPKKVVGYVLCSKENNNANILSMGFDLAFRKPTYIIAEAGVNHNGNVQTAIDLITEASAAGADCVKFQTFKAEQLVTESSPKAKYQTIVTDANESQFQMLKNLELGFEEFRILLEHCKRLNIDFLSTPYNKEDVDLLDDIGVSGFKIASGQLTEIPFLKYVASKGKTTIVSTGMGTLAEVFEAVEAVRSVGNEDIVVLQCTTNYPSRIEDANILAMKSIGQGCKVRIGYSDHVPTNFASYAAVALGAEIIEKHFTLDKFMEGPDHSSSLNPDEFKEFVIGIRNIEKSLGDGIKRPSSIEKENMYGMKRSIVVLSSLPAGTKLEECHLGFKRPANGLSPSYLTLLLGQKLSRDMEKDEPLQYDCISW